MRSFDVFRFSYIFALLACFKTRSILQYLWNLPISRAVFKESLSFRRSFERKGGGEAIVCPEFRPKDHFYSPMFQKKVVYLFTNESNPFGSSKQHITGAAKNAEDLRKHGAEFAIFPLLSKEEEFAFTFNILVSFFHCSC